MFFSHTGNTDCCHSSKQQNNQRSKTGDGTCKQNKNPEQRYNVERVSRSEQFTPAKQTEPAAEVRATTESHRQRRHDKIPKQTTRKQRDENDRDASG